MSLYSLEKKEDSQIKSEHKENVGNLHIIKLPLTKYELSLFKCEDPIIIEKQLGIYETFSSLPQKLRILPKFHGKSPEGLFFQPLRKTLKLHLKENPIVSWKDLLKHYKALINGLACLQSFGILALKLDLDSIYVSESGEYKVLIYDTINGDKHDILDNSVFELALLIISLGIGKNADINILDEHFLEFQSKIHVNGFEEKQQLKELILTLKSILSKNSEKLDFLQLFIRSLNFKSFDNIKKMIIIEETHGLEIAYDILIKKEFMKFQLKSLDNKLRIFGFSSIPLDKEFEKIEEIKLCLDEIKPIRSLNFLISSDFNEESFELIDNILSKKVFRLDDFKSLIIQMAPSKQVVGFSEWFKFIWHSFYKDGLKPIDSSGLAIIKEHYSYWFHF